MDAYKAEVRGGVGGVRGWKEFLGSLNVSKGPKLSHAHDPKGVGG